MPPRIPGFGKAVAKQNTRTDSGFDVMHFDTVSCDESMHDLRHSILLSPLAYSASAVFVHSRAFSLTKTKRLFQRLSLLTQFSPGFESRARHQGPQAAMSPRWPIQTTIRVLQ